MELASMGVEIDSIRFVTVPTADEQVGAAAAAACGGRRGGPIPQCSRQREWKRSVAGAQEAVASSSSPV